MDNKLCGEEIVLSRRIQYKEHLLDDVCLLGSSAKSLDYMESSDFSSRSSDYMESSWDCLGGISARSIDYMKSRWYCPCDLSAISID